MWMFFFVEGGIIFLLKGELFFVEGGNIFLLMGELFFC